MRGATRRAFENLIQLALDEAVDFVLLVGDLYDGARDDYNTAHYLNLQLARLNQGAQPIPVFLVRGNHDAVSQITRALTWPKNVVEFSDKQPTSHQLQRCGVWLHGRSYPERAVTENYARSYPPAQENAYNIGLLHTCATGDATGRGGHEPYAPCDVADMLEKGYQYWALGHVHTRETLATTPTIAFPGNIQGRHVNEPGPRGCLLVSVEDGQTTMEFQPLDVVRWVVMAADLTDVATPQAAIDTVARHLAAAIANADGRLLAVRVRLVGETALHAGLLADPVRWLNELRTMATTELDNQAYIERLQIATRSPPAAMAQLAANPLVTALTQPSVDAEGAELEGKALSAAQEQVVILARKVRSAGVTAEIP